MGPKRSKRKTRVNCSSECSRLNSCEQGQSTLSTGNDSPIQTSESSEVSLVTPETSLTSVVITEVAEGESDTSTSTQPPESKTKRAKKAVFALNIADEKSMLEFLQENPILWDMKLTDFRITEKKNRLWEEQGLKLDKTADFLKGWFKSLRDTHTRLDKRKSGDGTKELTEREQWIKDNFSFLKVAIRHRPEPVCSVSKFTYLLISLTA